MNMMLQQFFLKCKSNPKHAPLPCPGVKHAIHLNDPKPIKQAAYKQSPVKQAVIDAAVNEQLERGLIRPSNSAWSSPVVLVPKHNGDWRMCIDFRKVNTQTRKDAYPIPLIKDCLNMCKKAQWLTLIDIKDAYHHIEMEESSIPMTAFVTARGLFEWVRMPFGVTNGPATFQRYVDDCLRGLIGVKCAAFFDDCMVFTTGTFEEHVRDVLEVLTRLADRGLEPSWKKSKFGYIEILFIGHILSGGTITPDPEKIRAVMRFPVPKDLGELRSFLGLANYYHDFIAGFAMKCKAMYLLTRKDTPWSWSGLAHAAFEQIKTDLCSKPCLYAPDFELPFILQTDASGHGIGAVLTQEVDGVEHPLGYISRQLSKHEVNYSAIEWECLAVVWAIGQFEVYLIDKPFVVVTDHAPLQWLPTKRLGNSRLQRWALLLSEFTFTVRHRAGKKNANADALSRCPIPDSAPVDLEGDLQVAPSEKLPHFVRAVSTRYDANAARAYFLASLSDSVRGARPSATLGMFEPHLRHGALVPVRRGGITVKTITCAPGQHPQYLCMLARHKEVREDFASLISKIQPFYVRSQYVSSVPWAILSAVDQQPTTYMVQQARVYDEQGPQRYHDIANELDETKKASLLSLNKQLNRRTARLLAAHDKGEDLSNVQQWDEYPSDERRFCALVAKKNDSHHPVVKATPSPHPTVAPTSVGGTTPKGVPTWANYRWSPQHRTNRVGTGGVTMLDLNDLPAFIDAQHSDAKLNVLIRFLRSERTEYPAAYDQTARRHLASKAYNHLMMTKEGEPEDRDALYYYPSQPKRGYASLVPLTPRLVVPEVYKQTLMRVFHDAPFAGHLGERRTLKKISVNYYWESMALDVVAYVQACVACKTRKSDRHRLQVPPGMMDAPTEPFELVSIDFAGPFKKAGDYEYVLVVIDHFTRWAITIPTYTQKVETVVKSLIDELYNKFGMPRRLLSDRGSNFMSQVCKELHSFLGVKQLFTSAYHPQTNGMVERFNSTFKGMLAALEEQYADQWVDMLQSVTFAYNTSVHETTKMTPYYALFGREAVSPGDSLAVTADMHRDAEPMSVYVEEQVTNIQRAHEFISKLYERRSIENSENRRAHARIAVFHVGDLVWLRDQRTHTGKQADLGKEWSGPWKVVRTNGIHSYELNYVGPPPKLRPTVANITRLKVYHTPGGAQEQPGRTAPLPPATNGARYQPDQEKKRAESQMPRLEPRPVRSGVGAVDGDSDNEQDNIDPRTILPADGDAMVDDDAPHAAAAQLDHATPVATGPAAAAHGRHAHRPQPNYSDVYAERQPTIDTQMRYSQPRRTNPQRSTDQKERYFAPRARDDDQTPD